MKAVQAVGSRENPRVTITDSLPKPIPKGQQILIRVSTAGITADELTWPELYDTKNQVPGHDVCGIVEGLGTEYAGPISVGDYVFGSLSATAEQGCQAEYALAGPDEVVAKPASIFPAEAAALPIPILTAWEAIFERAQLEHRARVLITGASGAVGRILVQLACHLLEAEVIALASQRHHELLKGLGARHILDYQSPNWADSIKDVDAVFDTVGSEALAKTWDTIKQDGIIITVADPPPYWAFGEKKPKELETHPDVRYLYFIITAQRQPLTKFAALLDEGVMKPLPVRVFPADDVAKAWDYAAQRGREGKSVIEFAPEG